MGHKVFKAGIATAIIQFEKLIPSPNHSFPTNCVLDFEKAKSVLNARKSFELINNGCTKVEVVQNNLESVRWSISPYLEIFQTIDSAGVKLKGSQFCDLVEQGIQTGDNSIFAPVKGFPKKFPSDRLHQRITNLKSKLMDLLLMEFICCMWKMTMILKIYRQQSRNT